MDRDIQIIAVLFTFYTASQLFWYWSCMIPPFSVLFLGNRGAVCVQTFIKDLFVRKTAKELGF